jgi:hypothetical protein
MVAAESARADDGGFQRTCFRYPAAKKHEKAPWQTIDGRE